MLQNIPIILGSVINVVKASYFNNSNLIIYDRRSLVTLSCQICIQTNLLLHIKAISKNKQHQLCTSMELICNVRPIYITSDIIISVNPLMNLSTYSILVRFH